MKNGELIEPSYYKDMMSYCAPRWISGYHFERATAFRTNKETRKEARPPAAPSLLLWGGRNAGGAPFLRPAFAVEAPPYVPGASGDHRLVGRGESGGTLF